MAQVAPVTGKQHPSTCSCPVCVGLECLERPRYFAGQLLTEAELNSEQAYVLAKNRLHNRYLHGWGVVCGLEVVCHDCEGLVTVKQGYALDPCGNDLIVCADHDFDVIKAIRDCRDARRRKRRGDCDPYEPVREIHRKDIEETWCITLEYKETEGRPITALRRDPPKACGCCAGCSSKCRCGCHSQAAGKTNGATCSAGRGTTTTVTPCEPTRILEGYQLSVVQTCEPCAETVTSDGRRLKLPSFEMPKDTLFARVVECLTTVLQMLSQRLSADEEKLLITVALGGQPHTNVHALHDACCRLRQAVIDLFAGSSHLVRCQLLHTLDQITCPQPTGNLVDYINALRPVVLNLGALIVQFVLDCGCQALLPPCGSDPAEDRIILACVTVRGDKIVRICNFACRRYAGAFPSVSYWLSAVPIIPVIAYVLRVVCCLPDLVRVNSPLVNDIVALLDTVDPAGNLRRTIIAEDFALPKRYAQQITALRSKFSLATLSSAIGGEAVNLSTLSGRPPTDVDQTFRAAGVKAVYQDVQSDAEATSVKGLLMTPFAVRGDTVIAYRKGNTVIGFGPYDEVAALRNELATLGRKVDALSKRKK
jgi:hypothetical protein